MNAFVARMRAQAASDSRDPNHLGAAWMTLAMAGYVVNDALIKRAAESAPLFESIFVRGIVVCVLLTLIGRVRGTLVSPREFVGHLHRPVLLRVFVEVIATVCYLLALTHMSLSNVVAIMQAVPLGVTLAAGWFLGETVSSRRYASVGIGLVGVLIIVRPGTDGYNAWSLLALVGVCLVVVRELATRRVAASVPSLVIALGTAVGVTLMAGVVALVDGWQSVGLAPIALLSAAALFLAVGYVASVVTVRHGEISFVAPFRYSVTVFAVLLQLLVFGDFPDRWTLIGCAIVVLAGIYSIRVGAARATRLPNTNATV